jgi:beta-galactosidase
VDLTDALDESVVAAGAPVRLGAWDVRVFAAA